MEDKNYIHNKTLEDIRMCLGLIEELETASKGDPADENLTSKLKHRIGKIICSLRYRYGFTIGWLQMNMFCNKKWITEGEIQKAEIGQCDNINTYRSIIITIKHLIKASPTPNSLKGEKPKSKRKRLKNTNNKPSQVIGSSNKVYNLPIYLKK